MPLRNSSRRYGSVARFLHWLMFLLFVVMFALAWYMTGLPNTPAKVELYNLHKSIGLTLLLLAALRLAWRRISPPPPLSGLADWERHAARASHAGLYVLMFLQPLSGLVAASSTNFPTVVFGLFNLPKLLPTDETVAGVFWLVHEASAIAILALVAVHAAAALRHHFWLKDEVLRRMLPFARVNEVES